MSIVFTSSTYMLGMEVMFCIRVCLNPSFFELASLDIRFTVKVCSQGICIISKKLKCSGKPRTFRKYFIKFFSFAWYFPATCFTTSWDLLLAFRLDAPTSRTRDMSEMRASYSSWLMLDLNSKFNDCSINRFHGPYNTTPMWLPLTLEAPSTERIQVGCIYSPIGLMYSTRKSSNTFDLRLPLGMYWIPYLDNSTTNMPFVRPYLAYRGPSVYDSLFLPIPDVLENKE